MSVKSMHKALMEMAQNQLDEIDEAAKFKTFEIVVTDGVALKSKKGGWVELKKGKSLGTAKGRIGVEAVKKYARANFKDSQTAVGYLHGKPIKESVERAAWVPESIADEQVEAFMEAAVVAIAEGEDTFVFEGKHYKAKSKKEKIEQLKIAFITKELDLSPEQAEKFWPVYNEMSDELKVERKTRRELSKDLRDNFDVLSDDDIKVKANKVLDSEIAEAELKKEYHEKIAGIIGYRKATKLLSLEQRFKRELLNKLNEHQKGPNGDKPRGPRPN